MFYDKFIKLCEDNGQKPTPVVIQLGLSQGNLQKWKNGAVVNADVIKKVAMHFGVSADYLLDTENPATPEGEQPVDETVAALLRDAQGLSRDEAEQVKQYIRFVKQQRIETEG